MDTWKYNTIWFNELPENDFLQIDYKKGKPNIENIAYKKYVILWHFYGKNSNFENLPVCNQIEYLEFNSANCRSFEGIENMKGLKRLEMHACKKLESDIGLSSLKDNLQWLTIDNSKKFKISTDLLQLNNLRVLCLNDCAELDSLNFISNFPNLLDLRFVNTNIVDGDLSPILKHPTLLNAGFLDKRHYSHKRDQIQSFFEIKSSGKKIVIHNGENKTYRYNDFTL